MSHDAIHNQPLSPAVFLGGECVLPETPSTPLDWIS